jgi:NAD(P)-dependent dehydrogenase (short-subunit alcohol dehydrogenase family)
METEKLFSLKGKTTLVTGAAQGLDKEIAIALANSGTSLVLSDIQDPKRKEVIYSNPPLPGHPGQGGGT